MGGADSLLEVTVISTHPDIHDVRITRRNHDQAFQLKMSSQCDHAAEPALTKLLTIYNRVELLRDLELPPLHLNQFKHILVNTPDDAETWEGYVLGEMVYMEQHKGDKVEHKKAEYGGYKTVGALQELKWTTITKEEYDNPG